MYTESAPDKSRQLKIILALQENQRVSSEPTLCRCLAATAEASEVEQPRTRTTCEVPDQSAASVLYPTPVDTFTSIN